MAFTYAAFTYMAALIIDAFLIFFSIFHVIAFDELKTDYKDPIEQCDSLNPVIFYAAFEKSGWRKYLFKNVPLRFMMLAVTPSGRLPLLIYNNANLLSFFNRIIAAGPKDIYFIIVLVLPEYGLHIFYNILFLLAGEWFSFILHLPLIAYHVNRYRNRPVMSKPGLYDATTIMNSDNLTRCQREGWIKLAFYLLSFFYYLYGMIYSLIST